MSFKAFTDDTVVAWTDIETTGLLNPAIIEVGVAMMDDFVTSMHTESGLLGEYQSPDSKSFPYTEADEYLRGFMVSHLGEDARPLLGGSSITFDRSCLEPAMPGFYRLLHYRSIDMTSVSFFVSSILGHLPPVVTGATAHRSLGDLEENIAQWRVHSAAMRSLTGHES